MLFVLVLCCFVFCTVLHHSMHVAMKNTQTNLGGHWTTHSESRAWLTRTQHSLKLVHIMSSSEWTVHFTAVGPSNLYFSWFLIISLSVFFFLFFFFCDTANLLPSVDSLVNRFIDAMCYRTKMQREAFSLLFIAADILIYVENKLYT